MIDLAIYPYQRTVEDDVDFTATINGNLPGRLSYFSYTNFKGVVSGGSAVFDTSKQFIHLEVSNTLPFDLVAQGVLLHGDRRDFVQAGLRWRINDTPGLARFFKNVNVIWHASIFPVRWGARDTAADAWALEYFFRLTAPNFSNRVYVSGFYDQTFNEEVPGFMPSRPVIAEVQVGYRVWKQLHMVAEYRVNERRRGEHRNIAAGLEYKFHFQ
jgi:hypothetical protein